MTLMTETVGADRPPDTKPSRPRSAKPATDRRKELMARE
jgi:hypothetical protein